MSEDRALTIWQPWANLVMSGIKDVENRSWPVPWMLGEQATRWPSDGRVRPFRLWIHAGKTHDHMACLRHAQAVWNEPTVFGALLGSVFVTGCHHASECRHGPTRDSEWDYCSPWAEPDRYHWEFANPQPLPEPIPMKGRQGLWRLPDDVAVPA